jgi:hypothetical protein
LQVLSSTCARTGGVRDRRQYRDQWRPAHAIAGTLKA